MAKQLAFYFNASACTDCKACQVACQDKNNLPPAMTYRRVFQYGGGNWVPDSTVANLFRPSNVFSYSVSTACMHCENALCTQVCPADAITKREDGVVLIDQEKCIGCRYCEWACPYGAIQFDEYTRLATKCDFCWDLLEQGLPPACVAACPMRALDFGDLAELRKKYPGTSEVFPLPDTKETRPAVIIKPHRDAAKANADTAEVANWEEI